MIKVLNILSDTNIGGAGRVLLNYLAACDRKTFAPSVALPKGSLLKPAVEAAGAPVYEVEGLCDRSFHPKDVKTLKKLIRQVNPAIVHTHGSLSGRIAARQCHKVVIYTRHSVFPVPKKLRVPPGRWVNKLVNEHYADHIIAVSPAAAENLTDGGISPKKITAMMNGVTPLFRSSYETVQALRRDWGVAQGDFVAGILARLEPYKGHITVLEAAERLKQEGRRFKILIAGTGTFGETLKQEIAIRGLEEQVLLLGFWERVGDFLSALDVQLNASYGTEASSLSLLEGMSIGLPAIVSDYGGNPYQIEDGVNGLLFPAKDSAALAQALARLMDEPETLERLQQGALLRYRTRFTADRLARDIERVYLNTLEEKA